MHIQYGRLHRAGADRHGFEDIAPRKWQEACGKIWLHQDSDSLYIARRFEPCHIPTICPQKEAKTTAFELASSNRKSKVHPHTLFDPLGACAKGKGDVGYDYLHATLALQGRADQRERWQPYRVCDNGLQLRKAHICRKNPELFLVAPLKLRHATLIF